MTYQIISERKAKYRVKVSCPSDIHEQLKRYENFDQEHFLSISLNGAHEVIAIRIVSIGIVNRTIVHPREIFRSAIIDNAAAIIVAHNHPSGNLEPSLEDYEITRRLKEVGDLLGIKLLDHMIISQKGYYSFLEEGEL